MYYELWVHNQRPNSFLRFGGLATCHSSTQNLSGLHLPTRVDTLSPFIDHWIAGILLLPHVQKPLALPVARWAPRWKAHGVFFGAEGRKLHGLVWLDCRL